MTKIEPEMAAELYDPASKKKLTWKQFVAKNKHMRLPSGALDLKKIAKYWKKYKAKAYDPDPAPKGQRQSIVSPEQLRAIWAESDRRRAKQAWRKAMRRGTRGGAVAKGRTLDPKTHGISRPPKRWFYAMVAGIEKRSDVRNAGAVVGRIWRKLSPSKRANIKAREERGEVFRYDLPLPADVPTVGTGTVRTVTPFDLGEVQVNVSAKDYLELLKSRLFQKMRRNDGSTALVKRCKSDKGNVNMFVDRSR